MMKHFANIEITKTMIMKQLTQKEIDYIQRAAWTLKPIRLYGRKVIVTKCELDVMSKIDIAEYTIEMEEVDK